MNKIIMAVEDLTTILGRFEKLEKILEAKSNPEDKIIDSEEFLKLMKISARTAQTWRDNGLITFSQIGHKIYYKMSDVNTLINNNIQKFR